MELKSPKKKKKATDVEDEGSGSGSKNKYLGFMKRSSTRDRIVKETRAKRAMDQLNPKKYDAKSKHMQKGKKKQLFKRRQTIKNLSAIGEGEGGMKTPKRVKIHPRRSHSLREIKGSLKDLAMFKELKMISEKKGTYGYRKTPSGLEFHEKHQVKKSLPKMNASRVLLKLLRLGLKSTNLVIQGCENIVKNTDKDKKTQAIELLAQL